MKSRRDFMKQLNHDLLRCYFKEPRKRDSTNKSITKSASFSDPTVDKLQNDLKEFKFELKLFSLKLLQKTFKAKLEIETVRGLCTKVLLLENQLCEKSYLSTKSKLELGNKLKNYKLTFKMLKGEYLQSA